MNMQEAFDIAARGLIEQGCKSRDETDSFSRYRDVEGRKCALGFLIPDALYHPKIENLRPRTLQEAGILTELPLEFLEDLQGAHDNIYLHEPFIPSLKSKMRYIAKRWNLNTTELSFKGGR